MPTPDIPESCAMRTLDMPSLEELAREAQEHESAMMQQADKINSDTFLELLEERKRKVRKIAMEVARQMALN